MDPTPQQTRTVGIIGAGKSGVAIARLALQAGYTVKIASSGPARDTALISSIVAPGAIAVDVHEIAGGSDLIVLAVPLRRFRELPLHTLAGHTIIDVMNYWPPIDGILPEFENTRPSSAIVQDAMPATTRVVKTFNHLGYHQMEEHPRPARHPDRVALGVAGDDESVTARVMDFVDTLGFDPVYIGRLENSDIVHPETPLFGAALSKDEFREQSALATR